MSTPKPAIKRRRASTAPAAEAPAPDMRAAFTATPGGEVKNTSIDLPVELHKRLRRKALEEGTSMKALIIEAIEAAHPAD